jgi:excisionase family DNA binding protein
MPRNPSPVDEDRDAANPAFAWLHEPHEIEAARARLAARYSAKAFLTADEAAHVLGMPLSTVRAWARAGKLPGARIGRTWKFNVAQLLDHVRQVAAGNIKVEPWHSTGAKTPRITGADSRSAVERFANLPAPRTASRRKNSKRG